MSATSDQGAGDSDVSHCASIAANFIGWSSRASCASAWPLVAEKTVPIAANTSAMRSDRRKTCVSWPLSRW